jgi:competence protein ComGA
MHTYVCITCNKLDIYPHKRLIILTGHLVLSTMHSRDTIGCIYRLLELGIPYRELQQTLLGIVAQRLVETACPYCNENCSNHCLKRRKRRRMGIYEVVSGHLLQQVLRKIDNHEPPPAFPQLHDLLLRGVALGYIPRQAYDFRKVTLYD